MRSQTKQKIAFTTLFIINLLVIVPVALIVAFIVFKGWRSINWQFLSMFPTNGMREGGIFPAIVGTFYLVLGSLVVTLPLGVLAAIYLYEYAGNSRLSRIINLAIINLAGVPSIVYGLFGLSLFVVTLKMGVSILAGALTLSIMNIPLVITATREALNSVPYSFREVSYSLGVSKWQTIRHAVLPFALPGILTGAILSVARAAGETAPILFTVAAFYLPNLPKGIFDQAMALPYHLYIISTQIPNISESSRYGTALVLVALVLSMNLFAVIIRSHFRKRKKW